jgi:hypothetical protein
LAADLTGRATRDTDGQWIRDIHAMQSPDREKKQSAQKPDAKGLLGDFETCTISSVFSGFLASATL